MNRTTGVVGVVCTLITQVAVALPADRVVHVGIHVDPSNANSRVEYYLSLSISAQEQDGNDIGWRIDNFKITEKVVLGSDNTWDVDAPLVDTSDGLWWVTHVDPDNPVRTDFTTIAPVVDTAVANDPADDDLEFDVSEGVYTQPSGGDPWTITTAINFEFTVSGQQNPAETGSDEPVEIPDIPGDPTTSSQ